MSLQESMSSQRTWAAPTYCVPTLCPPKPGTEEEGGRYLEEEEKEAGRKGGRMDGNKEKRVAVELTDRALSSMYEGLDQHSCPAPPNRKGGRERRREGFQVASPLQAPDSLCF